VKADTFTLFDIETIAHPGQVELRLVGELDIGTAGYFREAVEALDHRDTVVLDLSRLTFIDSTGLHELVVARTRSRRSGGEVVLQAPSAQTRRVLEIVGFDRLFPIR
jgi:anti-sigma B factor antagonist